MYIYIWQHQAITWTNVDLSSVRSCDIHLKTISQELLKITIHWYEFENYQIKITAASPKGQWVKRLCICFDSLGICDFEKKQSNSALLSPLHVSIFQYPKRCVRILTHSWRWLFCERTAWLWSPRLKGPLVSRMVSPSGTETRIYWENTVKSLI